MIKLTKLENLIERFVEEFDDVKLQRRLKALHKYKREHPDCTESEFHSIIYNMIDELLAPMEHEGLVLSLHEKYIIYNEMVRVYSTYVQNLHLDSLYYFGIIMHNYLMYKAEYIKCTQKLSMYKNRRKTNEPGKKDKH